jgi:hypothetical protein
MLVEVPIWWAVSLIGCRKPSAEKRLWCDNQTVAPPRRQQASERRQEGTIGVSAVAVAAQARPADSVARSGPGLVSRARA